MLNQKLQLKLSQKLSPQQIQLMKLIQLSTLEFEQRLSREIEENPLNLLKISGHDYKKHLYTVAILAQAILAQASAGGPRTVPPTLQGSDAKREKWAPSTPWTGAAKGTAGRR